MYHQSHGLQSIWSAAASEARRRFGSGRPDPVTESAAAASLFRRTPYGGTSKMHSPKHDAFTSTAEQYLKIELCSFAQTLLMPPSTDAMSSAGVEVGLLLHGADHSCITQ